MKVAERHAEVAGLETRWLEAPPRGASQVLYLHGVPTASWIWLPFLERTGGIAPDLPGFGRSAKPAAFDYSIAGYDRFLEAFAAAAGLRSFSLVLHDWGVLGLALAQRFPERIERLVLLSCVPLLPGYRWHRVARLWRRPVIGELTMGFTFKASLRRGLRPANVTPLPEDFVDRIWEHFDHGTQRAILKLYRSAPEEVLARAGERLGELRCPTLILWSGKDPYIPGEFGQSYAEALGGSVTLELVDGGHWSWLDRPEIVERVSSHLR